MINEYSNSFFFVRFETEFLERVWVYTDLMLDGDEVMSKNI